MTRGDMAWDGDRVTMWHQQGHPRGTVGPPEVTWGHCEQRGVTEGWPWGHRVGCGDTERAVGTLRGGHGDTNGLWDTEGILWGPYCPHGCPVSPMGSFCPLWVRYAPYKCSVSPMGLYCPYVCPVSPIGSYCPLWVHCVPYGFSLSPQAPSLCPL